MSLPKLHLKIILSIIYLLLLIAAVGFTQKLCSRNETYNETFLEVVKGISYKRTNFKTIQSIGCCEGYKNNSNNCIPICSSNCIENQCIAPNKCTSCKKGLEENNVTLFYGNNCEHQCNCNINNTDRCDQSTGKCNCRSGWMGDYCDEPCPNLKFGKNCIFKCECKNKNAICSRFTGECICQPGYHGVDCNLKCTKTYGHACAYPCACLNGASCAHDSGKCICLEGWRGINCELPCDRDTFGKNCEKNCSCFNGGSCDPKNGICKCAPGWKGPACNLKCSSGYYGYNCTNKCLIFFGKINNTICDYVTGEIVCESGYTGDMCNDMCQNNTFGLKCESKCNCTSYRNCNHVTGECECPPGWIGENCETRCLSGNFGLGCTENCSCMLNWMCNNINGKCLGSDFGVIEIVIINIVITIFIISILSTIIYYINKIKIDKEIKEKTSAYISNNCTSISNVQNDENSNRADEIRTENARIFKGPDGLYLINYKRNLENDCSNTDQTMCPEHFYYEIPNNSTRNSTVIYDHLNFSQPQSSHLPQYVRFIASTDVHQVHQE